jgi:hypothetical protein
MNDFSKIGERAGGLQLDGPLWRDLV